GSLIPSVPANEELRFFSLVPPSFTLLPQSPRFPARTSRFPADLSGATPQSFEFFTLRIEILVAAEVLASCASVICGPGQVFFSLEVVPSFAGCLISVELKWGLRLPKRLNHWKEVVFNPAILELVTCILHLLYSDPLLDLLLFLYFLPIIASAITSLTILHGLYWYSGKISKADLKGKRVFVRLDLNVPLDKNQDLGRYQGARRSSLHQVLDVHAARVILSSLLVFDLFPSQLQINLFLLVDLGNMAAKKYVGSLKGKREFVDVDLNVPLDDNHKITDDTRVYSAVPTIKYSTPLLSRGSSSQASIAPCPRVAARLVLAAIAVRLVLAVIAQSSSIAVIAGLHSCRRRSPSSSCRRFLQDSSSWQISG
ncbi:unnamed protein product, partial [Linum tenue]